MKTRCVWMFVCTMLILIKCHWSKQQQQKKGGGGGGGGGEE